MRYFKSMMVVAMLLMLFSQDSLAGDLDRGKSFEQAGQLEPAAEFFCQYAQRNPNTGSTAEALVKCGRLLDTLQDTFTEQAEKRCYWGKKGSPDCMRQDVARLNGKFGPRAFSYLHAITYIPYSGVHYRTLIKNFPKSKYVPEADFYLLIHELVGHPDTVLPKIKAFLKRHPKGKWHRKGLLVWARVNEDVWYVHKKWSWVLYNYQVAPEEMIVRAEPYRQEALRTYEKLMKDGDTFEGRMAAREYPLLKQNRDDGKVYSIVNDSSSGTLGTWGITAPQMQRMPATPSSGAQPTLPPASAPEKPVGEPYRVPQRWD